MARQSAIDALSPPDREWLNRQFMDKGFCGYEEIAALLAERGYSVGKSSIHRYGQKLERKLAAVQASTHAAMLIAEAAPDDADQRSNAVLSLIQTEIFNALVDFQEATDTDSEDVMSPADRLTLLAKAGKGIADLSKASVNQKKWQIEIREKTEKAAEAVASIVKKGGLSQAASDEIKRQILGIAS
jgi:hypothetical protein